MILFSSHISAQTCKEMFVKANSYFNAGKYDDAKNYYQQVIKCGDKFFIKDCESKINLINDITYKAKKTAPFGLSRNEVIIPYQGGDAVVTVNGGSSWQITRRRLWNSRLTVRNTVPILFWRILCVCAMTAPG